MTFDELFQITPAGTDAPPPPKPRRGSTRKSTPKKELNRGCDYCPLNKVEGVKKIKGQMTGKRIWIVAQSPGPDENEEGRELVGPSGKWWWKELHRVGVKRSDCDIQNVVRCFPADRVEGSYDTYLKMRSPSAEEIRCCSVYTDEAIEKSKAPYVLVLGQVAAKALLNTRSIPQRKIFWSERLNARVYLLQHPSFFIRGYASKEQLETFRKTLDQFGKDYHSGNGKDLSDQFAYLREQDYRLVTTPKQARKAERIIRAYAERGRRIAVDIEDYNGTVTVCGFSPKPGMALVFIFQHRDQDEEDGKAVQATAKTILEDSQIKKVFHYGCSDVVKLRKYAGIRVRCFDHDTLYSEYMCSTDAKQYGLDAIAERRFPEFAGYKYIVVKEMLATVPDVPTRVTNGPLEAQHKFIERHGHFNITALSLETLRLYNGADCDITKRIETDNRKNIKAALLKIYIDLSFVLQKMEKNGPYLDYRQNKKLMTLFPGREAKLLKRLRKALGNSQFNPGSPQQVAAALFDVLDLEFPGTGKPNTRKGTLLAMGREHKFPLLILEWRAASKAGSTYVDSYRACADANNGQLATTWWATGTRTGRLSSGGGRTNGKINLQNIHNDPHVRNQCVADPRWRTLYRLTEKVTERFPEIEEYWAEKIPRPDKAFARAGKMIENWVRKNMPDFRVALILDYGQIEVRVVAQLSGDQNLIDDCKAGDIHTTVGTTMTGWPADKIRNDPRTRTVTKNIHFAIIYGSGVDGVYTYVVTRTPPDQEPMERELVESAYRKYFERYSGVAKFIETQRVFGREHKYVETLFGMKQQLMVKDDETEDKDRIEETDDDDGGRNSYWGNQCINGPVQGTAHQLLECGLVNLKRNPKAYAKMSKDSVPMLDVHDALYLNPRLLDLPEANRLAKKLMEEDSLAVVKSDFPHINWVVPIETESEAALTLGCKVKITKDTTPGTFMLEWFRKRRKQEQELATELEKLSVYAEAEGSAESAANAGTKIGAAKKSKSADK